MTELCLGHQVSVDQFGGRVLESGDPSKDHERALIDWYGQQVLRSNDGPWGYCATSSEQAVLCGLWMARKSLSNRAIVFASAECRPSVPKAADILGLEFVPIRTEADGGMSMRELSRSVLAQERERAVVVVLTMGSDNREAYDDVLEFERQRTRFDRRVHVHVDAAHGGAIYPFTNPKMLGARFDTFNVSLHKFWGAPRPCALFLCSRTLLSRLEPIDHSVSRTRDAATVEMLSEYFRRRGFASRNVDNIHRCLLLRDEYARRFKELLGETRVRVANKELSLAFTLHDLPVAMAGELRRFSMPVLSQPCRTRFDTRVCLSLHVTADMLDELIRTMAPYAEADPKPPNKCAIA